MLGTASADQIISLSSEAVQWLFTWSCQAFLLLVVAWVGLKLDRSRSATTRYRIWLIALLAVAALPLLTVLSQRLRLPVPLVSFPASENAPVAVAVGPPQAARPSLAWPSIIWPLLFAIWSTGALISLLRLGRSLWKHYLVQSGARAVSLTELDCSYSDQLQLDADGIFIALSEGIRSPQVGLFRPVILLPADIVSWTSREERTSILRHELAHIQRRDQFANLFQSLLAAFFFFHPMLRYACRQLSLEREIACDDRVLNLCPEPKAYAETILKAAERSCLTDIAYQAASFNPGKTLERRIEMIMNADRTRQWQRQWPFLLVPMMLIAGSAWLVIPAVKSQPVLLVNDPLSASNGPVAGPSVTSGLRQTQLPPVVNKSTVMISSVEKGPMLRQVRGLGALVSGDDGRLKAMIQIPETQARDLRIGEPASIDTREGIVAGKVIHLSSTVTNGVIPVEVSLEGTLPQSARAGLTVDGVIEIDRLDDVLYLARPAFGREGDVLSLFKLEDGGATATRVQVRFGMISVTVIEILEGLSLGDKVIISDMSGYAGVNSIRLN